MPHSGCKYLKFKGIVSMIYFKSSAINRKNTDNVIKKWAKNLTERWIWKKLLEY